MPDLQDILPGLREGYTVPLKNLQGAGVTSFGNVFFVNSTGGSDTANNGRSPNAPLATLSAASTAATASNNDIIYVMPGHTETLIAAAGVSLAKAGVTVVGLGVGRNRPIFNYTTSTAASFNISAANVTVSNLVFNPTGVSAVVAAINVTGADVSILNSEMQLSTGTNGTVLGVLTAATAARLRIENSRFLGPATSTDTTTAAIKHEVGIDYVIRNNEITGKLTQGILNATTLLGGLIDNNRFVIATGTLAISVAAASTPFITNNRINVPSGTTPITAAAGFVAGNIYSAAAGVTAGTAATI